MVFAALDIGSNGMRLLFCRVYTVDGKPHFSKEELIRMPIRLGEDVFLQRKISPAKADRLITALRGFPLDFAEDKEDITEKLTERGKIFESLLGHHYRQYSGTAITWDRDGNEVPIEVSGRIVVDIDSFDRLSPYRCRSISDFTPRDMELL